jgi:hypothetical protein
VQDRSPWRSSGPWPFTNSNPAASIKYLKVSHHTGEYWDTFPVQCQLSGFFPNA